jgi:uncharacterized membrane protein YfcA
MPFEFHDYVAIAIAAFVAQVLGGIAGYGTGLLMPMVLVPIIGAEATIPVIGLSALITNPSRVIAFRPHLDKPAAWTVICFALPTVIAGAYAFTLLNGFGAQLVIGAMLMLLSPFGRYLRKRRLRLSPRGFGLSAVLFGFIMGGTSGSGVLLLSILMARGLAGSAVIATDAAASTILGLGKVGVFAHAGIFANSLWIVAALIGLMAIPGAWTGKMLLKRFPISVHNTILDVSIFIGGALLVWGAWRG